MKSRREICVGNAAVKSKRKEKMSEHNKVRKREIGGGREGRSEEEKAERRWQDGGATVERTKKRSQGESLSRRRP